jgi:hypothetical protein
MPLRRQPFWLPALNRELSIGPGEMLLHSVANPRAEANETFMRLLAMSRRVLSCLVASHLRATRNAKDKEAFLTARKAAPVKTWDAAIDMLDEIEVSKIETG